MIAFPLHQEERLARLKRSHKDIFGMARARMKQFQERNEFYSLTLSYYFGRQPRGSRALHEVLGSSGTGMPLLRDLGMAFEVNRKYVSNRMAPIVEDYQALIGRLPSVRVEAPSGSDLMTPEAAEKKAEKQTKYLYSTYDEVSMAHHQAFAGFTLSCLGDALYMLEVDSRSDRVLPSSVLPTQAFPSFRRGPRKFELWDLLLIQSWSADDVKREYGFDPGDNPEDTMVYTYLSPYQRTVLIGNEQNYVQGSEVVWDLGFCPAVWIRNKINGGMGGSDIAPVLALQDMYDFTLNVMADGLVEMTYPVRMIKGRINMQDGPMLVGPGANVEVGPDGDVKAVALAPPPQAGMSMAHTILDDLNIGSGTTDVRQHGMPDKSNISGRALHAAQGPQATRIDLKQIILGEAFIRLNAYMMAMQENAPLIGSTKLDLHGRYKGKAFREEFVPKDDIDGWYLNTATWDELVGVTRHQRIQMAGELKQMGLADDLYVMDLAGIEDPVEMQSKVERDMRRKAQLQQELTPQPGGAPPGGGGPPTEGAPPAPPGGGGIVGQGPKAPPMLFEQPRPGGQPAALPTGVPGGGVSRKAVERALEGADLKGTVFAVGALATDGQAPKVTLTISNQADYRAVREAVLRVDPKPQIRYMAEDNMPEEKVRVA